MGLVSLRAGLTPLNMHVKIKTNTYIQLVRAQANYQWMSPSFCLGVSVMRCLFLKVPSPQRLVLGCHCSILPVRLQAPAHTTIRVSHHTPPRCPYILMNGAFDVTPRYNTIMTYMYTSLLHIQASSLPQLPSAVRT